MGESLPSDVSAQRLGPRRSWRRLALLGALGAGSRQPGARSCARGSGQQANDAVGSQPELPWARAAAAAAATEALAPQQPMRHNTLLLLRFYRSATLPGCC